MPAVTLAATTEALEFWIGGFWRPLNTVTDTTNSFTIIVSNKISKINYLIWAKLRHSVPTHLKKRNCLRSEISLTLSIDNKEFDKLKKNSKEYYMPIKRIIAQCPKNSKHFCQDFNLTQDQLKKYSFFQVISKMINVHYAKRIRNPFTTSFSNADTPSSFGRNFNVTFTHWLKHSSVWPYKTLLQEYYIQIALRWIIWY